jgi:hypothetical protein
MKIIFYIPDDVYNNISYNDTATLERKVKTHSRVQIFEPHVFLSKTYNGEIYGGYSVAADISEDEYQMINERMNKIGQIFFFINQRMIKY